MSGLSGLHFRVPRCLSFPGKAGELTLSGGDGVGDPSRKSGQEEERALGSDPRSLTCQLCDFEHISKPF